MRKYEVTEAKKNYVIVCNKCGREITVQNGIAREEAFHGEMRWGYFSGKDGEKHTFDLCETCYDEWIRSFLIPVEVEEETELL